MSLKSVGYGLTQFFIFLVTYWGCPYIKVSSLRDLYRLQWVTLTSGFLISIAQISIFGRKRDERFFLRMTWGSHVDLTLIDEWWVAWPAALGTHYLFWYVLCIALARLFKRLTQSIWTSGVVNRRVSIRLIATEIFFFCWNFLYSLLRVQTTIVLLLEVSIVVICPFLILPSYVIVI